MAAPPEHLICNGELKIVRITEDLFEEAVEIYRNFFMKYENVSISTNLLGSPETIHEMDLLIRYTLKDLVSFGAIDLKTNKLVGFAINKIINPSTHCTLEEVAKEFRTPNMMCVMEYLSQMEDTFNIFEQWHIDCAFEIMFLSTRPEYGGRGIAVALSQHSVQFARQMMNGSLPDPEKLLLPPHVRYEKPKAVCSVLTALYSQKVGQKLGLETLYKVPNTAFSFEGKTFYEKINSIHEFSIFAAMKL